MKVTTYTINKGTASQYYGLKSVNDNHVLYYAPNNWKTKRGAINWAKKNGYEVEEKEATPWEEKQPRRRKNWRRPAPSTRTHGSGKTRTGSRSRFRPVTKIESQHGPSQEATQVQTHT